MDILCVLHDSDEYGVCRWPLADLARAAGAQLRLVKELADKDVLKGGDKEPEPFVHTPRHAGKSGEPVTLVATDGGPCWYSSRLVRDEWVRLRRGAGTRFGDDNPPPNKSPNKTPKQLPNDQPNSTPIASPTHGVGEWLGYGPSSSSSSSVIPIPSEAKASGGKPPQITDPDEIIFGYGVPMLTTAGTPEKQARSFLGGLRKQHGDEALVNKLRDCAKAKPLQPLEWLAAALPPKPTGRHAGFEQKNYREGVTEDGSLV